MVIVVDLLLPSRLQTKTQTYVFHINVASNCGVFPRIYGVLNDVKIGVLRKCHVGNVRDFDVEYCSWRERLN
jgi:hypothetical protein